MHNMIPLKEAINIFEQHKISLMRDKNPHIFHTSSFGGSTGFSSYDYIISKTSEWLEIEDIPQIIPHSMGKGLLDYVSKKYYKSDGTSSIHKELQLYGKKPNSKEFIEVYINYYENSSQEIEFNLKDRFFKLIKKSISNSNKIENKEPCQLFENYNYDGFYNYSINYTVMGDIETNKISYIDISVDENELKTFLESDVFSKKLPKHIVLINEAIDKYLDKVNKVFRETIEKETKKDPKYIPFMDHFTKRIIEIKADTLDEFLDKHIELQEKYNKTL